MLAQAARKRKTLNECKQHVALPLDQGGRPGYEEQRGRSDHSAGNTSASALSIERARETFVPPLGGAWSGVTMAPATAWRNQTGAREHTHQHHTIHHGILHSSTPFSSFIDTNDPIHGLQHQWFETTAFDRKVLHVATLFTPHFLSYQPLALVEYPILRCKGLTQ